MVKTFTKKGLKYQLVKDETKGHIRQRVLQVETVNKENMPIKTIDDIYEEALRNYDKNDIMIRAFGPIGFRTLKSRAQNDIDWDELDEYIGERVANKTKFKQFYGIQLLVQNDTLEANASA